MFNTHLVGWIADTVMCTSQTLHGRDDSSWVGKGMLGSNNHSPGQPDNACWISYYICSDGGNSQPDTSALREASAWTPAICRWGPPVRAGGSSGRATCWGLPASSPAPASTCLLLIYASVAPAS